MQNCPVCGAPALEDTANCFKCGSDMNLPSDQTPSLMAKFKDEADLEVVDESFDPDDPSQTPPRRKPTNFNRAPQLTAAGKAHVAKMAKARAKGTRKARPKAKPPRPKVKPPRAKPPKPKPRTPPKTKARTKEKTQPGTPTEASKELGQLVGSPQQDLAMASKIYAELVARGGLEDKTMQKLNEAMSGLGADPNKLRSGVEQLVELPVEKPVSPNKEEQTAETKAKGRSKAKPKGKTKSKAEAKKKEDKVELPEADEEPSDVAASHCPHCGKESAPEWVNCPFCGIELPPHCPSCKHEMSPDWRFCPYCGNKELTQQKL